MASIRPFALVRTLDQWLRCSHDETALEPNGAVVELASEDDAATASPIAPVGPSAGLAFDGACVLYHSQPIDGQVEEQLWAARDPSLPGESSRRPMNLFASAVPGPLGDFVASSSTGGPLDAPRGLAVDDANRLFVAEWGQARVLVYDLPTRQLLRSVALADPAATGPRPIDLAARGDSVWILTESPMQLLSMTAHGVPHPRPLASWPIIRPTRLAVSQTGRVALLDPDAKRIFVLEDDVPPIVLDVASLPDPAHATGIAFESEDVIVVAYWPGEDFFRLPLDPGARLGRHPLKARGYDGLGITNDPHGRIGFWTARGFRNAAPVRLRYAPNGTLVSFRLDAGEWQTTWGRLFLDACIPDGSDVQVGFAAVDEPPEEAELDRKLPANMLGGSGPDHPELSPPMPPLSFVPSDDHFHPLHRRESGRELPWAQPHADDTYATYEAPINASAGRYLWVFLRLSGNTRVSPRIRCLRAEYPSHDWLRRLPRAFSREETTAAFLGRYLAIMEGFLSEADARGAQRATLLDPAATPDELLPWLASFMGLVLDERWSVQSRRTLISEITCLWRFRGTLWALTRMIEIYLGVAPILVEAFRLRGIGATILGADCPPLTGSVVGASFRVGGVVSEGRGPLDEARVEDAFATHAHRFSVIVPMVLDEEQRSAVRDILEAHRPAHTLYELCTVGAGMQIGRALHVGLSSVIGRGGAFRQLQVGGAALGRDAVLGRPLPSTKPGVSELGTSSGVA